MAYHFTGGLIDAWFAGIADPSFRGGHNGGLSPL
jgi:hypothetical protein